MVEKQIRADKLSSCGIDISHLTFDVTYINNLVELFYLQVGNINAGFKKLLEHTGQNCHFVMDATVVYYIRLAFFNFTQGFKYTIYNLQLITFAGLCSIEYFSGASIKRSNRIYKKGGKPIRDVLYMCAMNTKQTNEACKQLFYRLKANRKTGKQALSVVMNNLLKQLFAVVINNSLYQHNYCTTLHFKGIFLFVLCAVHVMGTACGSVMPLPSYFYKILCSSQ